MRNEIFTVLSNVCIAPDVFRAELCGDTSDITRAGQFINIKLDGFYLRRPISICDFTDGRLTIIYKTVGDGTLALSRCAEGTKLDVLTALGNGYNTEKSGEKPLLIGGGVGIPPLYGLCKALLRESKAPQVILGFNKRSEIFLENEFKELGVKVTVTTCDGSYGVKGFVTAAMENADYDYFYTCGPAPMFRAIESAAKTDGQFSFEERMGCGFGACMGCSCKTKYGNKRICKDGPVLERGEIIW